MNNFKTQVITFAFAMAPYILVTWGYTEITNGNTQTFWTALGVLLGVRLFFSLIETLGSILAWRLYGKKVIIQKMVAFLSANKLPKREYQHDDIGNYLARIEGNHGYPESVRCVAKEMGNFRAIYEDFGILSGWRLNSAMDAALDIYSPRQHARQLEQD